jgi:hypothetical protein
MSPTDWSHLAPPGPQRAVIDGRLSERAVSVRCPVCKALPGDRCDVDPDARPYPSTMRIGFADPFHIARSLASDA